MSHYSASLFEIKLNRKKRGGRQFLYNTIYIHINIHIYTYIYTHTHKYKYKHIGLFKYIHISDKIA